MFYRKTSFIDRDFNPDYHFGILGLMSLPAERMMHHQRFKVSTTYTGANAGSFE
jgi:hypothetical protein